MAETYGMSYADAVHAKEAHPRTPLVRHSIEERAKRPLENGSIEWIRLYNRQDRERRAAEGRLQEAKQEVRKETRQEIDVVRPLSLSDVRSPAGLSHYIDRSGDEAMKILEEAVGLESTWKILLLTGAHTSIELGKGLADILKIGEGTAEWAMALDRKDLSTPEKALAMTKGIGMDGLRALGIVLPGLSKLGPFLKNLKIPENTTGVTTPERPKMGDYRAFSGQRGAVGERVKPLVWFRHSEAPLWLTRLEMMEQAPKEFKSILDHEVKKIQNSNINFEAELKDLTLDSRENLRKNYSEYANRWIGDMLSNMNNLVYYLENYNPVRLWIRKRDYWIELRNHWFEELYERIQKMTQTKWFKLSEPNQVFIEAITRRLEKVIN